MVVPTSYRIQRNLPDKRGSLTKQGRMMGLWVTRHYKFGWDGASAVLMYDPTTNISPKAKRIPLDKCLVSKDVSFDNPSTQRFCLKLEFRDSSKKLYLYASSELDRDEWFNAIRQYSVNSSIENSYDVSRSEDTILGTGATGTVYKVVDRATKKQWALKEITKISIKSDVAEEALKNEVNVGMRLGLHDNIIFMKEFVENADKYYIVLEYLTGGELYNRILEAPGGHFTEAVAANIMRQLLGALAYLHDKQIAHRDLKPENFLMASPDPNALVKLADFGTACTATSPTALRDLCGTAGYVAPEVIKLKVGYGVAADMWSMGVVLYTLLTGLQPFYADSDDDCFNLTLAGVYDTARLADGGASEPARAVVARMLVLDPAARITAAECVALPWVAGGHAPARPLNVQENMRSWRAKRRLRKAIFVTVATARLQGAMNGLRKSPSSAAALTAAAAAAAAAESAADSPARGPQTPKSAASAAAAGAAADPPPPPPPLPLAATVAATGP